MAGDPPDDDPETTTGGWRWPGCDFPDEFDDEQDDDYDSDELPRVGRRQRHNLTRRAWL